MLSVTQYRVDDDFFICRVARNSRNNWLKPPLFRCLLFPMVHKPIKLFAGGTVDDLKLALVTLVAVVAVEAAQSTCQIRTGPIWSTLLGVGKSPFQVLHLVKQCVYSPLLK